jgi:hypothetical protein
MKDRRGDPISGSKTLSDVQLLLDVEILQTDLDDPAFISSLCLLCTALYSKYFSSEKVYDQQQQ